MSVNSLVVTARSWLGSRRVALAGHALARRARVDIAHLRGQDLIVHSADRRSAMYDVVYRLCREAGFEPTVRHEVGETSTLVTLVAGGLGVAVVPEPVKALALGGIVYRPLGRPATSVELAVAHRADRHEPHLTRTLDVVLDLVSPERRRSRGPGRPPVPPPDDAGGITGSVCEGEHEP